jgi:hypothetical protein
VQRNVATIDRDEVVQFLYFVHPAMEAEVARNRPRGAHNPNSLGSHSDSAGR